MVAYTALTQIVVLAVEHVPVEGHLAVSVVADDLVGCGWETDPVRTSTTGESRKLDD